MDIRFFKRPYVEKHRPGVVRLLFEGKLPQSHGGSPDERDFYLYAWISTDKGRLDAFQAVLSEKISLIYRFPGRLHAARIGHSPMNRSLVSHADVLESERIVNVVKNLESERFPVLVKDISSLAADKDGREVFLTKEELEYLMEIKREADYEDDG